jgi:hypothetical protein
MPFGFTGTADLAGVIATAAEIHVPRAARAAAAPGLRVRGWVERLRSEASGTAVVYRTERKAELVLCTGGRTTEYRIRNLNVRGRATAVVGRRRSPPFGRFVSVGARKLAPFSFHRAGIDRRREDSTGPAAPPGPRARGLAPAAYRL